MESGVNGLLDVARQTYKEGTSDAYELITELGTEHALALDVKYEPARKFFIRISTADLAGRELPSVFINVFRRKNLVECQTLDLLKINQKIADSHHEVLQMSDENVQKLLDEIRLDIAPLFKISEAIGILDMVAAFAHLVTTYDYCQPELTDVLAIKSGRHPIRERIDKEKYISNDVYAAHQSRFQIITGCNMSGKSNYIRSTALMAIMAQIGSFVPASYASFPTFHSLFASFSTDDSANEANTSTFALEMREMAFLLRNIDHRSLVIVDELGRGTSTRDGLCIAIAVAEALVESGAIVWFVTHFRDLPRVLAERAGVVSLHLSVDMSRRDTLKMLYRVASGPCEEQHYGLALAKVVDLPQEMLRTAEYVSKRLTEDSERSRNNKSSRLQIVLARKRKLMLGLKEQLTQAKDGNLRGQELLSWLKALQDEFVIRIAAIEAENAAIAEADTAEKLNTEVGGNSKSANGCAHESHSTENLDKDGQTAINQVHSSDIIGNQVSAAGISFSTVIEMQQQKMTAQNQINDTIELAPLSFARSRKRSREVESDHVDEDEEQADWWCIREDSHKKEQRDTANDEETRYKMTGAIPVSEDEDSVPDGS